jgi:phospholipid-binding lipoprotein MlaA
MRVRPLATSLLLLCASLLLVPGAALADEEADAAGVQADVAESDTGSPDDPWERMNRKVFGFNEGLDRWVLEPAATGWDKVVPEPAQRSIGNFFANISLPMRAVNEVFQGKPWKAYETTWRLVINSVVGLGGLFDPASHYEVHKSDEDFGQTLGVWGVPRGPYWVLPFLGASSPRAATGMAVDRAPYFFFSLPIYVTAPAGAVNVVNARAGVLEDIAAERKAAFDFYTFVRSSYLQFRENRVRDREEDQDEKADDDLYYYLEEDDDG